MALSTRSILQWASSLPGQFVRSVVTNWGLLGLAFTILVAGALAFSLVAVPPGTVPYP